MEKPHHKKRTRLTSSLQLLVWISMRARTNLAKLAEQPHSHVLLLRNPPRRWYGSTSIICATVHDGKEQEGSRPPSGCGRGKCTSLPLFCALHPSCSQRFLCISRIKQRESERATVHVPAFLPTRLHMFRCKRTASPSSLASTLSAFQTGICLPFCAPCCFPSSAIVRRV